MDRTFIVDRGDARRRIDHVLVDRLPQAVRSRARVQRWIEAGRVTVNGVVAERPALRLQEGQHVDVRLPAVGARTHAPEPLALDILFEDEWLIALDKPAGLVVHPTRRYPTGTLLNGLLWHLRDGARQGCRPRLVHRLDRETSGLLIVAKLRDVHARLARAMARRQVRKDYLALVYGVPRVDRDRIDLRIGRDAATGRLVASRHEGRACSTSYELLARSSSEPLGLSLLRCTLGTGRLHQIRVHLSAIGHPLVGDPVYGEPRWRGLVDERCARACAAFGRQALHASRLQLTHPVTGEPLVFEAPPPDDLAALLSATAVFPLVCCGGAGAKVSSVHGAGCECQGAGANGAVPPCDVRMRLNASTPSESVPLSPRAGRGSG